MAPAVALASKGFPVSYALAEGLKGSKSLAASPESKRIFQKNGAFYDVGEKLAQPELAQTLERISKNGANEQSVPTPVTATDPEPPVTDRRTSGGVTVTRPDELLPDHRPTTGRAAGGVELFQVLAQWHIHAT